MSLSLIFSLIIASNFSLGACDSLIQSTQWERFFDPVVTHEQVRENWDRLNKPTAIGFGFEGEVEGYVDTSEGPSRVLARKHFFYKRDAEAAFRQMNLLNRIKKKLTLNSLNTLQTIRMDGSNVIMSFVEGRDVESIIKDKRLPLQKRRMVEQRYKTAAKSFTNSLQKIGFKVDSSFWPGFFEVSGTIKLDDGNPTAYHMLKILIGPQNVIVDADTGSMTLIDLDAE